MPTRRDLDLLQLTDPGAITPTLRRQLIDCWIEVANNGGAVGFPFPPVDSHQVAPVADALIDSLNPHQNRLLLALLDGAVAGWVALNRDLNPLIEHWGIVRHLQTHPAHRDHGLGSAMMQRLRQIAREEMSLEQLHLAARGGIGLEDFYRRLGWREVGRWPNALRLAIDDTRDEVLMILRPL
ncbi:GNAT family N-acetyltransferase [Saccharopolyspora spinosa]|uniref:Acetyltransferase (GNAT) family protein n=1 Tax=Saccharopolyspora spinosa TaxID=60894 RepID=A0A2N3Y221_SACSN|nr:GNAT family N-acetyltransferase [Saccharopolyspora spinosa]PKW16955.1 acetyltransferase (GNAT) family protein [Saccharopolyspora spinosa]